MAVAEDGLTVRVLEHAPLCVRVEDRAAQLEVEVAAVTGTGRTSSARGYTSASTAGVHEIAAGTLLRLTTVVAGMTVRFPASPSLSQRVGVKNVTATTTDVTLDGNGANVENPAGFDLAATQTVAGAGFAVIYEFDGTEWVLVHSAKVDDGSGGGGGGGNIVYTEIPFPTVFGAFAAGTNMASILGFAANAWVIGGSPSMQGLSLIFQATIINTSSVATATLDLSALGLPAMGTPSLEGFASHVTSNVVGGKQYATPAPPSTIQLTFEPGSPNTVPGNLSLGYRIAGT